MMKTSLYELTNEFLSVMEKMYHHYGEDEIDQQVISDTLDSLQAPIEEKVENIVKYMRSLETLAEAKKAEAKRLSESAAKDLKKAEFFKNYMADNLRKAGITKLQAGVFSLGWRKGSEVVEIDESKLPSYEEMPALYVPQEPKLLGKPELKKILNNEITIIPGVSLVRKPDSLVVK